MKEIRQTIILRAPPQEVYEALLDEEKHTAITGASARIHRVVGGSFSMYDNWITGKIIGVAHNKKIVQLWKGNGPQWPKNHFSIVTLQLRRTAKGTKVELKQEHVPDELYEEVQQSWKEHYWSKMKAYFQS